MDELGKMNKLDFILYKMCCKILSFIHKLRYKTLSEPEYKEGLDLLLGTGKDVRELPQKYSNKEFYVYCLNNGAFITHYMFHEAFIEIDYNVALMLESRISFNWSQAMLTRRYGYWLSEQEITKLHTTLTLIKE